MRWGTFDSLVFNNFRVKQNILKCYHVLGKNLACYQIRIDRN